MSNLILILQNLKKGNADIMHKHVHISIGFALKNRYSKNKKNNSTQTDAKLSAFFREGYIFSN